MIAPVVATRYWAVIPLVLPVIGCVLDVVMLEYVVIKEIIGAIHQIDAGYLVIRDMVLGDITARGAAHAQAKPAIPAKKVSGDSRVPG